jgi:hypothetical protein
MATKSKAEKSDLAKAVEELDQEVTVEGGTKAPDLVDTLAKAAADSAATAHALAKGELVVSGKKVDKPDEGAAVDQPEENAKRRGGKDDDDTEVEEDADADEETDKSEDEDDDLAKAFMDGLEEHVELLDASPALLAVAEGLAKSTARTQWEQQNLRKAMAEISQAVSTLLKSHVEIHRLLKGRTPMAGIVGIVDGKAIPATGGPLQVSKADGTKLAKSELQARVARAVEAGKLPAYALAQLDSPFGIEALLSSIPEDVAKAYDIPKKNA